MSRDRKAFDAAVERQIRTAETARTRTPAPASAPMNRRQRRAAAARQSVPVAHRASTLPVLHMSDVTGGNVLEFALNGRIVSASLDQLVDLGIVQRDTGGFSWELGDTIELEAALVAAGLIEARSR